MSENNDTLAINGRIKNLCSMEDLTLSPAGLVLVNIQTHYLKKLYDFSETLHYSWEKAELDKILKEGEDLPRKIMSILTPKPEDEMEDE